MLAPQLQTFSKTDMPLVPQTAPTVVLPEQGPSLHAVGHPTKQGTKALTARKSLDFGQSADTVEPIVVHDIAIQTPLPKVPNTPQEAVGGTYTGTLLETTKAACHPGIQKCKDKKLQWWVFLSKDLATGKQFRPRSPPLDTKIQ